jgi:hypothetical protein
MKCWSQLTSLFKASMPPAHEEIEQHVRRLNGLRLAYQQLKTMTVAQWRATEREVEMEVQWFAIHRLQLPSTSSPILPPAVPSADAIGLESQLTLTGSPSR